jgi:hypothetical protein
MLVLANDFFLVQQRLEGFNLADLGWGTANAKTITVSFWVSKKFFNRNFWWRY